MSSFFAQFGILAAIFIVIGAFERVRRLQHTPSRVRRPWFETDLLWFLVAALAAGVSTLALRPLLVRLAIPGLASLIDQAPGWAALAVAIVIFDGVFFVVHRMLHRSDLLWNVHKVHHSSRHLDVLATTRTHAFEHLVRNVPSQLVLFALGFEADTIATTVLVLAAFGAMNHSNLRVPLDRIEWLAITPRLHRVHHVPSSSLNNYATIFSVWDRLAGTLRCVDLPAGTVLGVPGEVHSYPQSFVPAFLEPARQTLERRRVEPANSVRTTRGT
jgi:sterol desaturase/sphingolipid hydroxylase (fatty acid hydroxylase superfamily)